jgi:hypothetical protein
MSVYVCVCLCAFSVSFLFCLFVCLSYFLCEGEFGVCKGKGV